MNKDEFETLINSVRGKINETDSALISEDLLGVVSSFNNLYDEVENLQNENGKLKSDKDEP